MIVAMENIFGERLKKLRHSKGITQKELAEQLQIGRSSIAEYEAGKKTPTGPVVAKIAKYFSVSTDYLLGLTDDPTPKSGELPEFLKEKLKRLEELQKKVGKLQDILQQALQMLEGGSDDKG